jgi:aryl-alcohol dehydrogenase-like predicted oxidoreductase
MRTGRIPGIEREASRIVLGVAAHADPAIFDAFADAGGNCFDTAHHYGERNERALGAWIESRGVRDRVVLVGKGAHTPTCAPEWIAPQLDESLDRLRTGRLDLYLLHRDDPSVPVGEWADALDAEVRAGRVAAVGVSNWSAARAAELDQWAERHDRTRVAALSNQLSLAEMLEPPWRGCRGVDGETWAWLARTGTPLVAWSATARGFFTGRPDDDEEVRRCWLSPANVARRERAAALAASLGVPTVAVALAWVLAQPLATFAAVGPRDRPALDAVLAADRVELGEAKAARLSGP